VNEESNYVAMIETLGTRFNELWPKLSDNHFVFQMLLHQAANHDSSSNNVTGLEACQDITRSMDTGSSMNIDDNGLYDSMLSLDMGDW
jgi:hypothetical protein